MAGGWEKCDRPAERAVAVIQAHSNYFHADFFKSRWGKRALDELLEAGVLRRFPFGRLSLEPRYRVASQWKLEFAQEHGEAALRKELTRSHRAMRRWELRTLKRLRRKYPDAD